ncbi:TatD family hydrolase [Gracilibacillus alcaliphilus]|uniref:TatD family hydrolase n=1 Tax=Gracilibacillus alcaliphilus TaxID=1401441 RepID=UPI001959BD18|nr:TatD family hydrolase [Gracilibacillus alcaliphilus]MBM7675560.1 TatD DNase family protein [Gracilibacillus alcaliphilus]
MIDAHIHLDWYQPAEREQLINRLEVNGMIAVSNHLKSCKEVWQLAQQYPFVYPAFGWHPEQPLPSDQEIDQILQLIEEKHQEIIAIGEVGLPYYTQREDPSLDPTAYRIILERFVQSAKQYDLPIVLHAVYQDAVIACDLLEDYQIQRAHFHWFKGDQQTINRLIDNQYMISITPDCWYEKEIQALIKRYPLELIMAETDGPWPFEGPFQDQMTHPNMIIEVIKKIAALKQLPAEEVQRQVTNNTIEFYRIHEKNKQKWSE